MELGSLVPDKTYDLTLPLLDSGRGTVHLLLCLSGIAVNEKDECDGEQNDITEENYVSESKAYSSPGELGKLLCSYHNLYMYYFCQ